MIETGTFLENANPSWGLFSS